MPVILEYSTFARCSPQAFWDVFQDVSRWPLWNPAIAEAFWKSGEPWKDGSELVLRISQPAVTLNPRVIECKPPFVANLKGKSMGVTGEQWFVLQATPEGVNVMARQEMSGAATMLVTDKMKQTGLEAFTRWIEAVKREAEGSSSNEPVNRA